MFCAVFGNYRRIHCCRKARPSAERGMFFDVFRLNFITPWQGNPRRSFFVCSASRVVSSIQCTLSCNSAPPTGLERMLKQLQLLLLTGNSNSTQDTRPSDNFRGWFSRRLGKIRTQSDASMRKYWRVFPKAPFYRSRSV